MLSDARPATVLPDVQRWTYSGNVNHPTEKTGAIICPLVTAFSRRGDAVLDLFMGSGTTGLACARTDRRFIGIELDEHHAHTAQRRIADAYRRADLIHLRPTLAL